MAADNTVTMTGWIVSRDAEASKGQGPCKFRMSTYCGGSKAKDNVKKAFVTVKQFDMDLRSFVKGTKVRVVGSFDPWETDDGRQVLDVLVSSYDPDHRITVVTEDGEDARQDAVPQRRAAPPRQEPSFEDDPF